ncbi:glutathione S-transferase family protein [Nannocystaceae bacterium ST9]
MQLYHNPLSPNGRKVLAAIAHLGLGDKVEAKVVNPFQGETRTPEFLGINPNAKIPALVDGDFKLWESNVIVAYLADKAGNTEFWPTGNARYDAMRWMTWEAAHFSTVVGVYLFENILKSMMGAGDPDANKLEQASKDFARYGKVLDEQLGDRPFLLGGKPTVADFCVCAPLGYAGPAKVPVEQFPNLVAWMRRMDEVPAWASTAHRMGG